MMGSERSFSAVLRWRSRLHPEWEVDTRHPSFPSPGAAALAANGLGACGLEELRLERGRLFVVNVSGRRTKVRGDVVIWTVPAAPLDLPDDFRFERADETVQELSRRGLDGGFEPRSFRVIEDRTGADVHALLIAGRSRVVVFVSAASRVRGVSALVPIA